MGTSGFLAGAAVMAPAVWAWWRCRGRARRAQRLLDWSTGTIRGLRARNEVLAGELAAAKAAAPAAPRPRPSAIVTRSDAAQATVVIPAQRDATALLPVQAEPGRDGGDPGCSCVGAL